MNDKPFEQTNNKIRNNTTLNIIIDTENTGWTEIYYCKSGILNSGFYSICMELHKYFWLFCAVFVYSTYESYSRNWKCIRYKLIISHYKNDTSRWFKKKKWSFIKFDRYTHYGQM